MKKCLGMVVVVAVGMCLYACGGGGSSSGSGSSGGGSSPVFATIDDMPGATSPMAASSPDISVKDAASFSAAAAENGMKFSDSERPTFGSSSSRAACEMYNIGSEAINSAAQGDKILCYIKYLATQNDQFAGVDLYDGVDHVYDLNISSSRPQSNTPSKVKFLIQKTGNSITGFTMHMCAENNDVVEQNEYIHMGVADGTTFTMVSKGVGDTWTNTEGDRTESWQGNRQIDVEGTLDADGYFTSREIVVKHTQEQTDGDNLGYTESTFIQTPGAFNAYGYQYYRFDSEGNTNTHSTAAYVAGQMIGDTSTTITDLAMGHGALFGSGQDEGTWNGDVYTWSHDFTDAWDGDTGLPVLPSSDSPYYTAASLGTVPEVAETAPAIAFDAGSGEVWDCSDVSDGTITGSENEMEVACSQYGSMNSQWLNCYQLIEQ